MTFWFIFQRHDVLLERLADGTYTIPCANNSPITPSPKTHILNVMPALPQADVKTFNVTPATPINENQYEWCDLRASYYKLSHELYLKAGKCHELNAILWRMRNPNGYANRHFKTLS